MHAGGALTDPTPAVFGRKWQRKGGSVAGVQAGHPTPGLGGKAPTPACYHRSPLYVPA